jgi:hypothetical protein
MLPLQVDEIDGLLHNHSSHQIRLNADKRQGRECLPLMQCVAVQGTGADGPALLHASLGSLPRRLLFGCQHVSPGDRRQPCNRLAIAGDNEFLARLDRAYTAGERLVGVAQAERLAATSALPPGFSVTMSMLRIWACERC